MSSRYHPVRSRSWSEYWAQVWNARGRGRGNLITIGINGDRYVRRYSAITRDAVVFEYANRRAAGYSAERAFDDAKRRKTFDAASLAVVWTYDDNVRDRGDFPDNANVLNRCEYEHGGRHVESRDDCGNSGGRGHYPGTLSAQCHYRVSYDVSACHVIKPCEEHEDSDDGHSMLNCRHCDTLTSLWGIEESFDNRVRDEYRMSIEDDLITEALGAIENEEQGAQEYARMC